MPALHRSALLALGAALALCACNSDASPEPGPAPDTPPVRGVGDCAGGALKTEGPCAPRPQVCPMIYHPVCGVDGRTYPNACHAERLGVAVAHSGACERSPPAASPGAPDG